MCLQRHVQGGAAALVLVRGGVCAERLHTAHCTLLRHQSDSGESRKGLSIYISTLHDKRMCGRDRLSVV